MLSRRTWEPCPIDCTEALGNIYGNMSQTCHPKGKTYRDAQLGELIYSIVVEHTLEHELVYGSEPMGRRAEKVKLLLNSRHIKPQAVRPQCHHEDDYFK
jgi:hypothetical protein